MLDLNDNMKTEEMNTTEIEKTLKWRIRKIMKCFS